MRKPQVNEMKSLKDYYNTIDYLYYSDLKKIDLDKLDNTECYHFIEEYFKTAGKPFLTIGINTHLKNSYRSTHSVMVYLMGVVIVNKYKSSIKLKISSQFLFFWFLTCLYHDYYSNPNSILDQSIVKEIDQLIDKLTIGGLDGRFSPEIIKRYFEYKEAKEHGILAGLNLNQKLKNKLYSGLQNGQDYFIENNLKWSKKDIPLYDMASSIIIKHNIWLANSDSQNSEQLKRVKDYNDNNLNELIIKDKDRIKISDDYLLFIFYIIDTIEPVKMFNRLRNTCYNFNYSELLTKISLTISKKGIQIKYTGEYKDICCNTYVEAKLMETWMNIKVSTKCTKNHNTLYLKFL